MGEHAIRTGTWTHGEGVPVVPPRASVAARRRSIVDGAVLGLIALVVVLVSLPRLRRFVLRENEADAVRALRVLSEEALAHPQALASGGLAALLESRPRNLEDLEILDNGRLRRHGYLFASAEPEPGRRVILAWPWEHGRTGLAAFAVEPGADPVGCCNADGRFSGPARAPEPPGPPGTDLRPWTAIASSVGRR